MDGSAARSPDGTATPWAALAEALSHGSGEVCIRSGDTVARIHVQDGHIAWATVSSSPARMEDVVARSGVLLDADMASAVKQECRATGAHFMDVLVKWGVLDRDRAREALRSFVADQVKLGLELSDATALFLPKARFQLQSERLRFRASEIPSVLGPESRRAPVLPDSALARLLEDAMKIEGAIAAAVLDRDRGECQKLAGEGMDTLVARSQVRALAALGTGAEEVISSAGDRCFVTRALGAAPALVLFVVLSSSLTSIGMARIAVASVASRQATIE